MLRLALGLAVLLWLPSLVSADVDFDGRGRTSIGSGSGDDVPFIGAGTALGAAGAVAPVAGDRKGLPGWASDLVNVYSELAEPIPSGSGDDMAVINGKTLWRGTQLNKGEPVEITEKRPDGWWHVNIPRQNYSGWIKGDRTGSDPAAAAGFYQASVKPDGTSDPYRQAFLAETKKLEGVPYVWGGRSPSGVDCSGLVQLGFSYVGMGNQVPRTAHEQKTAAKVVDPRNLQPGDLIFTAHEKDPNKITHVVIYTGQNEIREAPQTGSVVRTIDAASRFGVTLKDGVQGENTGKYFLYFGTFFN